MRIVVLSGKGGTGKTTIAASLALSVLSAQYVDCDVEEPNGAIFLKPHLTKKKMVKTLVPVVDEALCDGCGVCARTCRFNAIAVVKKKVLFFPEVCHHCGACQLACPQRAISEVKREIGVIEQNDDGSFVQGCLHVGEPVAVPMIQALKKHIRSDGPVILDSAPGASCTVVQTVMDSDACLLVTEPTPFGLHDLSIAVQLMRAMKRPFFVVVNKAVEQDTSIQRFCEKEKIDILLEVPFSRKTAEQYAKGRLVTAEEPLWKERFQALYHEIKRRVEA